jgi:hypothetical protein
MTTTELFNQLEQCSGVIVDGVIAKGLILGSNMTSKDGTNLDEERNVFMTFSSMSGMDECVRFSEEDVISIDVKGEDVTIEFQQFGDAESETVTIKLLFPRDFDKMHKFVKDHFKIMTVK